MPRVIRVSASRIPLDEFLSLIARVQPKQESAAELRDRAEMLRTIAHEVSLERSSAGRDKWSDVPDDLRRQLPPIIRRLVCTAFFARAPQGFIDEACAWLKNEPGGAHGKRWQLGLTNLLTHTQERARTRQLPDGRVGPDILWNEDGSPADAPSVVRRLASNVRNFAPEGPSIFDRLRLVGGGGVPDEELDEEDRERLRRTADVVRRLQRSGVHPEGVLRGGGRYTAHGAAKLIARRLELPFARSESRVDRSGERGEASRARRKASEEG